MGLGAIFRGRRSLYLDNCQYRLLINSKAMKNIEDYKETNSFTTLSNIFFVYLNVLFSFASFLRDY